MCVLIWIFLNKTVEGKKSKLLWYIAQACLGVHGALCRKRGKCFGAEYLGY
jgi:hypothetical protein